MVKGWSFDHRNKSKPYKAQIVINNKIEFLGNFATEEEAHAAYLKERAKHPRLPHTGGAKKGSYIPPRLICPNCNTDIAKPKYAMHYEACTRHYPDGRKPWSLAPNYRRKKQYIKKAERIQQNGQQRADN